MISPTFPLLIVGKPKFPQIAHAVQSCSFPTVQHFKELFSSKGVSAVRFSSLMKTLSK